MKKPKNLYNILIFRLALALNKHGLKCRSWPTHFSAHNLLPVNILTFWAT